MADVSSEELDRLLLAWKRGYNDAIEDILSTIENEEKVLVTSTPNGLRVLYKETLLNVIKKMRKS